MEVLKKRIPLSIYYIPLILSKFNSTKARPFNKNSFIHKKEIARWYYIKVLLSEAKLFSILKVSRHKITHRVFFLIKMRIDVLGQLVLILEASHVANGTFLIAIAVRGR